MCQDGVVKKRGAEGKFSSVRSLGKHTTRTWFYSHKFVGVEDGCIVVVFLESILGEFSKVVAVHSETQM